MTPTAMAARPRPPRNARGWTGSAPLVRSLAGWALLILILALWSVTLRPTQLGGPATFIVVSGDSMEPTLHSGDLVILRAQDAYEIGDIATFAVPEGEPGAGALVIHRLVRTEGDTWVPQGDNRDREDDWRPTDDDIKGELWAHVPHGGERLMMIMQPPLLAALAGGVATMWFLLHEPKKTGEPDTGEPPDQDDDDE